MSEASPINDDLVELCLCEICKGYLSCGPIRLLPNGRNICGRCTPLNPDIQLYRQVFLEKFLSLFVFPCRFKRQGCLKQALFGQVTDHEAKCAYQFFACPVTSCLWTGLLVTFLDHFKGEHPDLVKQKAEFKMLLAENSQGILMGAKASTSFIVKYSYDAGDKNVKYDIRSCTNGSAREVLLKIQLRNDSHPNCYVNLKLKKCLVYDNTFYDIQSSAALDLSKFYEMLAYPDCVVVSINLKVVQTTADDVSSAISSDSLKCRKCYSLLISPLFYLDGNVCCGCGKCNSTSTPSSNEGLSQPVRNAEISRKFRVCKGVLANACPDSSKLGAIITFCLEHLNAEYVSGEIVYKLSYSELSKQKFVCTVKNNAIVVFCFETSKFGEHNVYQIGCISSNNLCTITATVIFEHQLCKRKLGSFTFNEGYASFMLCQVPPNFNKNEEFVATITIEE